MVTAFGSSSNVFEVLDEDNYLDWSETTQAYLMAQDLWDVVHSDHRQHLRGKEKKDWEKKNAAALHAIRISCGRQNVRFIRGIFEANKAWQTLKQTFDPELEQITIIPTNMASTSHSNSLDQITEVENANNEEYKEKELLKPLLDTFLRKEWNDIKMLCDKFPALLKQRNSNRKNAPVLHDYLSIGKYYSVEHVIKTLNSNDFPREALDMTNSSGGTALTVAVGIGHISIVECLVEMKPELLSIPNNSGLMPVVMAIGSHFHEMADYLYEKTPQEVWLREDGKFGATLIIKCLEVRKLDIAIKLLKNHENLMLAKDANGKTPMYAAACAPSLFHTTYHHRFLSKWISNWLGPRLPLKLIRKYSMNMKVSGIELLHCMEKSLSDPMEIGLVNDAILESIKRSNFIVFFIGLRGVYSRVTHLIDRDNKLKNMCMCAIEYRQSKVLSYLFEDYEMKQYTNVWRDELNNNILHIAGKLAPPTALDRISGPALQLQRELQWFKEVENFVQDSLTSSENIDHVTPRELFTMNHKDLVLAGEKWMKDTAYSCTIVGPLIITIMFAAAFQIPGGNDQEKGFPIFFNKFMLKLYIVSVAISLFSATTSVLVFLKILTSNYTEEDFLKPLPNKMIIGLSILFLSLATMIVAFCSGLFLTLHGELRILTPIITLAAFPVGYFGWTQFPLLVEIWTLTYRVAIFDKDISFTVDRLRYLLRRIPTTTFHDLIDFIDRKEEEIKQMLRSKHRAEARAVPGEKVVD